MNARILPLLALALAACAGQVEPQPGSGAGGIVATDPVTDLPPPTDSSNGGGRAPTPPGVVDPPTTPQSFPWVASCPAAPSDPWVPAPAPTGTIEDLRAYAAAVRASFVGHWKGQQSIFGTTPNVAFDFEASNHYSGICLDAAQCWATIYNRTDNESPAKKFELVDMSLDGISSGTIDLVFPPQPAMGENPSDPPYIPARGTNVLRDVKLDVTGNRLRFDLVSHMQAPPYVAHYDLYRCP